MAGQQRTQRPQSQRGDVTGRKAEVLKEQAEDAVDARRGEMGMVNSQRAQVKQEGVINLMGDAPRLETGERVDLADKEPVPVDEPEPIAEGREINRKSGDSGPSVKEIAPPEARPRDVNEVAEEGSEMNPTRIHVLFDLEDVTMGQNNTFSMRAGYRYELPRWMAEHLADKGVANILTYN